LKRAISRLLAACGAQNFALVVIQRLQTTLANFVQNAIDGGRLGLE
jgi:hypothetical protein